MYIPSSEVMFKLMRSCIDVKNPEDLVFFNKGVDTIYRMAQHNMANSHALQWN